MKESVLMSRYTNHQGNYRNKDNYQGRRNDGPHHGHNPRGRFNKPYKEVIRHDHFGVRKLPKDIFEHYCENKGVDDISSVLYSNSSDSSPTIKVQKRVGDSDDYIDDIWRWKGRPFHSALTNLPKQIYNFYRQAQKTKNIQAVEYFENDSDEPVVEVDFGPTIDQWGWELADNGQFNCWRLNDSIESDGQPSEINLEDHKTEWVLEDTEEV